MTTLKMPATIMRRWLTKHNACKEQVQIFAKQFPNGAEVTLPNLLLAAEAGLEISRFAEKALTPQAFSDYQQKRAPLDADYQQKRARLLAQALGIKTLT